jgi:hypothetical protein
MRLERRVNVGGDNGAPQGSECTQRRLEWTGGRMDVYERPKPKKGRKSPTWAGDKHKLDGRIDHHA